MNTADPPADPAADLPSPPDTGPAVVSLDEVRAQRQRRQQEAEARAAAGERKLFERRQDLHRALLQDAIASGRMFFSDFADMIKLGIVTDEEDQVPCAAHGRDVHYGTWVDAFYGDDAEDPDQDLLDELFDRLRKGGVDERQVERLAGTQEREVPQ